jgi:rhodanese-related sulfurtransferase
MSEQNGRKPIRISVEEAKERYDEEAVTIVDVVDPGTYEKLDYRIQDAVRIDPRQAEEASDRLLPERTVLVYCT